MPSSTKTLGLIPARGGSKGIQRKNIKLMAGKPLIAWTIEAALGSSKLHSVVVSTEDEEIAEIALQHGAQVPFMRPDELAQDDSSSIDTVLHALNQLPLYDSVLLLQPTSPLRRTADIDDCLELAARGRFPSLASVTEAYAHPHWIYRLKDSVDAERGAIGAKLLPYVGGPAATRRQDLPSAYVLNGALYFAHVEWLRLTRAFVNADTRAFVMERAHSLDIDTSLDWHIAELLLKDPP
jgi:CMP-N,N'-diacetyllegionaminic acid synthase